MSSEFVKVFRLTALETEVLFLSTNQVQSNSSASYTPLPHQSAANPDLERDL